MPGKTALNIPPTILEQLHCSLCKGYLSCGPVRVLPDGSSICGRCTPPNNDLPVYRVLALEAVLSRIPFPCRFGQRGCTDFMMFGHAIEHESKCLFRTFSCPAVPFLACTWEGSASNMLVHFTKKHPHFIMPNADFKLQLDQNSRGMLMVIRDSIAFLVKYSYEASECTLRYDVMYCRNEFLQGSCYKVQLFNDLDFDCSISLKTNKCRSFSEDFYNLHDSTVLNLNNYLQNLENPVTIAVKVTIVQTSNNNATGNAVNYELINTLRCKDCHNYLIPPLYDLDGQAICSDCAKTHHRCVPSKNAKIQKLIADANYPCRWRDCKFAGKSDQFKSHELTCKFRHYDCFFPSCQVTFKMASAIDHLQTHRAQYLPDGITYVTSFAQPYGFKHIFTIKDNVITLIQHSMVEIEQILTHRVALFTSQPGETTGYMDFEHQHCKLKSQPFILVSDHNTEVTLSQLPPCYKNSDDLTVVVNVNQGK